MPKQRRDRSLSCDRCRAPSYPCSSGYLRPGSSVMPPESEENLKEWEEARCSVCMEHPHNAVLLICSSHDKGCRPYMCDTSYRHSNCLDQFRKSISESQPPTTSPLVIDLEAASESQQEETSVGVATLDKHAQMQLSCPLCRGRIEDWIVVEPARHFMNAKSRSCSCEMCDFNGTYTELRKHARHDHPLVRPSEADPERQHRWRRLERQRDLGDLLSTLQSSLGDGTGPRPTVIVVIRVVRSRSRTRSRSPSPPRRRSERLRQRGNMQDQP